MKSVMSMTSRWIRPGFVLLVLAAVGLRTYMYAVGTANVPVTSDEALTVLQAVDIRNGEFPLLMSGQPYMFPVEAYWLAPLEPLLPRTAAGMRSLALLEGFVLAALGLWILRRMGRWREVWPGALLLLFPSAYLASTLGAYSMPYYASPALLVFLAAGCFAVLDFPGDRHRDADRRDWAWAAAGAFFLGMAISNSLAVLGMAVPLAVVALWNTAGRLRPVPIARRLAGFVAGGFLGLLPHLLSRWTIPGAHQAVSTMYPMDAAWERLWKMTIPYVMPGTLGCRPCLWPDSHLRLEGCDWMTAAFAWGAVAVFVAGLVLAVARLLREVAAERRWPAMGPFEWAIGASAAAVVLDALNRRATSSDFRYLLAVAYVAPFLLAGLWQRLRGKIACRAFGVAVVALATYNAATSLRLAEKWKAPGFASWGVGVPDVAPVLDVLRGQGIRHAVASHWAAYRIGFEADGEVTCAQPFNERFAGWPLPYKAEVDAADDVAYVLTDVIRFLKPDLFEQHMQAMGVEADVIPAGEFRVYCHFRQAREDFPHSLPAGEFRISANDAPDGASGMADGNLETFWRTSVLQTEGIAIECAFDEPVRLAGVRLRYGTYGHDRPKKVKIEVKRKDNGDENEGEWVPVSIDKVVAEPFMWLHGHPVYSNCSSDRFEFGAPEDAATLRISIAEPNSRMAWTLCEVEPLVP